MSKLGDKLNFNNIKSKAMATDNIDSAIPPRSGVNFAPGTVIEFDLPGNRPNEFLDLNNNLVFKLPVVTTGHASVLDRCGGYGFINKLEFIQNGVVLCSLSKYNVLVTALSDLQMSAEYKSTTGRALVGFEGDSLRGEKLPVGTRTFYLSPIASDMAMSTPHRQLFLGTSASITVRLTLESAAVALQSASGSLADYSVVQPQMIIDTTFLYSDTMAALTKAVGTNYTMLCNSYDHTSAIVPAGTPVSNIKLPFAKTSLERILFVIRPLSHTTSATKMSCGSRCTGNLKTFQLEVAGRSTPKQPIKVGEDSLHHLLKSDNIASNYSHGLSGLFNSYSLGPAGGGGTSSLGSDPQISKSNPYLLPGVVADGDLFGRGRSGDGTGDGAPQASNIGTFMGAINLESALTSSQNSSIYSGINTLNGVDVYFHADWGAGCIDGGVMIDFFSLSTDIIEVDQQSNMFLKKK
jgi:hypothetical protein